VRAGDVLAVLESRDLAAQRAQLDEQHRDFNSWHARLADEKKLLAGKVAEADRTLRDLQAKAAAEGRALDAPVIDGMVCPVPGAAFSNDFGQPRTGHTHQGNDMFGPMGTPNLAVVGGKITYGDGGSVRLDYVVPTRGLIGFRNAFLTLTGGTGIMGSIGIGYRPWAGELSDHRNGALTASSPGRSLTYGLANVQLRGSTFIEPGEEVYEGMIVGIQRRAGDMSVNVCREKKQSNVRAASADIAVRLTPATRLSLEQSLDFLVDDELLEVTPKHLRLRKRYLTEVEQARARRRAEAATA